MDNLQDSRGGWWVVRLPGRATTIVVALALVALSFAIVLPIMGATSGTARSVHGLYHSASIYQIWNGIVPPTNPLSIEGPAITYWGWYLFLCCLMKVFQISAFEAAILSNALALASMVVGLWLGTGLFRPRSLSRLSYCLVPLLVLTPHFLAIERWGFGDPRINLGRKFLNFNGFAIAVGLFSLLIYSTMRPARRGVWSIISPACLSAAICFVHPVSSSAVASLAGAGVTFHGLRWIRRREGASALLPYLAIILAFVALFPYMNGLRMSLGQESALFATPSNLAQNFGRAGFSLVIPVLILIAGAIRFRALSTDARILWLTCLQLTGGALLLRLPGYNQYKLPLLLSVSSAFLLCALLQHDPDRRAHVILSRIGLVATILLTAVVGRRTLAYFDQFARSAKDPYVYSGTDVDLRISKDGSMRHLQEAYAWLRNNTPVTSYVLERPVSLNHLEMSTVAQRRTVAGRGGFLNDNISHQKDLLVRSRAMVVALQKNEDIGPRRRALFAVPVDWPQVIYALTRNPKRLSTSELDARLGGSMAAVFANKGFAVFMIRKVR